MLCNTGKLLSSLSQFGRIGLLSTSVTQMKPKMKYSSETPVTYKKFETLEVTRPRRFVVQVMLNRPQKLNTMNPAFWKEMVECFNQVGQDPDCRAVVISAAGKVFTAGLDLTGFQDVVATISNEELDVARKAEFLRQLVINYQETFNVIEKCSKPVIAAVHNACVGGGVDLITACDIRYCSADAWFQVKEVDVGLAADVGTLQRLPRVVGSDSFARELVYTARRCYADEAEKFGLVSRIFQDKESLLKGVLDLAEDVASKSPVAVQGSKINLLFSRDHSVADGLQFMQPWNMCMVQSEDVMKAAMANIEKKTPTFSKL